MTSIILQPASSPGARKNYSDTIENLVTQDQIKQHVDPLIYQQIKEIYHDNPIPVWGVKPGINGVNIKKWNRIEQGDIGLFARDKTIFSSGSVTMKLKNRDLALDLWGQDEEGQTWEYIYFLDEMRAQHIPNTIFNPIADYAINNNIQGFNVLSDEKSDRIINLFDLLSTTYFPKVSQEEFEEELKKRFDKNQGLDNKSNSISRKEQGFLRNELFKNKKTAECSICHNEYPIKFLVTAHIKKRSECTFDEKLDVKNIVIPMCNFGCDDLFERGYVSVQNGEVVKNSNFISTKKLNEHIKNIEGNKVHNWNLNTKKYFDWHYNHHHNLFK